MFTQKWYLTYFLLPLLINFLQAYLSGWGGEGVCVCNGLGGNDPMLLCHYKSQLPENHWRENYNRNVKQSVRGFCTPAHVSYASIRDVCLDVKYLVVKTVGDEQSPEKVG